MAITLEEINKWHEAKSFEQESLSKRLRVQVTDKSIPLEERWSIFIQSGLGERESYIVDFDALEEYDFDYFVDLFYSKHELIDCAYFVDELKAREDADEINFEDLQEEILTKFIAVFTLDW